ncbi:MAG: hypothetical protein KH020_07805 [Clostridiales bacterium]|jgi:hypothetical protein|nr:hypothetical protein [Clostridiales bacterium]
MLTFKEIVRTDIQNMFLNPEEFAEEHVVNGKKMKILIDNNEMIEREKREKSYIRGIYKKQFLIYVAAKDYGPLPGLGTIVDLDGNKFLVSDAINEMGVYSINLEANKQ